MRDDPRADLPAAAHHEIEYAGRQTGAADDRRQRRRATRRRFGRFEDDAIAVGEGGADLRGGNRQRRAPRRDDADHAERFTRHIDLDAGARRRHGLGKCAERLGGEELEKLAGARGFGQGFRQCLADLAREQPAQFVTPRQHLAADRIERIRAALRRTQRPFAERRAGRFDGRIGLPRIGAHVVADRFIQIRRIERHARGRARLPAAIDVMAERTGNERDERIAIHRREGRYGTMRKLRKSTNGMSRPNNFPIPF